MAKGGGQLKNCNFFFSDFLIFYMYFVGFHFLFCISYFGLIFLNDLRFLRVLRDDLCVRRRLDLSKKKKFRRRRTFKRRVSSLD